MKDMYNAVGRNFCILILCLLISAIFPVTVRAESMQKGQDFSIAGWLAFQNPEMSPEDYQKLSPEEKARLKKKLEEWQSLPPEKQAEMRMKMNQLKKMPPEARQLYQQRFRQWQKLSSGEQNRILRQLENWENLSPEERENVRRQFR